MYGAVLRPRTELVESGQAHIGVLFLTNDGYSTMCGHATLAVARLLVDDAGSSSDFLQLEKQGVPRLVFSDLESHVTVTLHVPCGLVRVTVPVLGDSRTGWKTDTSKPISYLSVPSFAAAIDVTIPIPPSFRWPELEHRESVVVDIAYGGAFYIVCSPAALGFERSLAKPDMSALSNATAHLKDAFNSSEDLRKQCLSRTDHADLEFLYGTLLTDDTLGLPMQDTDGAETGLCFFSNRQVDRSPTGSGVQAKVALAYAKGERKLGERWTYHSLVSNAHGGEGAFVGEAAREAEEAIIVEVSGWARYSGCSSLAVEESDAIGKGFWFDE